MGFFDRAKGAWERAEDVAGGVAGVIDGTADLVIDIAQAPFTDDEYGGFWDTLTGSAKKSGAQILGSAIGPEKGLGALIGGLPGAPREAGREVLSGLETVYREGVAEPLSTFATAMSISDADKSNMGGWGGLFKGDTWSKAYKIAQTRSPGQAIAAAFMTDDINDEAEVNQALESAAGNVVSAAFDGVFRIMLDPTVVGGKLAAGARGTYIASTGLRSTAIRSQDDIQAALGSRRFETFIDRVEEIKTSNPEQAAGRIRDELFPTTSVGSHISTLLDDAADRETLTLTMRSLMGDKEAFDLLNDASPLTSHQIKNLMTDEVDALAREVGDDITIDVPVEVLHGEMDRLARWKESFGTLDEVPRARVMSEARATVARSDFYQKNPLTAPVRTITNMMPQHWADLNDARSDIQIARSMEKAKLPEDTRLALRGEYMAATTAGARQQIAIKIEQEIVRSIFARYGVPANAVDDILKRAGDGRRAAMGALKNRTYDAKGRGSVPFRDVDGVVTEVALPLHVTQQADLLPMVDVDALESAAKAAQRSWGWNAMRQNEWTDIPEDALNAFYRLWRPATLLRVGWPARVLMDEQLRMIAYIGGMTGFGREGLKELGDRMGSAVARKIPGVKKAERVSAEAVDTRAVGRYGPVDVDGVEFPAPFEGPQGQVMRQRVSSAGTMRELATGGPQAETSSLLQTLRQHTGSWKPIGPRQDEHLAQWADVLNRQIKQSKFAQVFLRGGTVDDGVAWLKTVEGAKYAREMGWDADNYAKHADDVADQVNRYAPEGVRERLLDDDVDPAVLNSLIPDPDLRPFVHGEELAQALGDSALKRATRNIVASAWQGLGRIPTDALSRQPFFAWVYKTEVERLSGLIDDGAGITPAMADQIAKQARTKALNQTQRILYDLAEKSEFAHMLRFISPFFMAWQEVLTRWGSLAAHNPSFAARARLVWDSPEKAGVVQDEHGYRIDENGVAYDPITDKPVSKEMRGKDRFMVFPAPLRGMPHIGRVRINKRGFNLVLTGTPGVGPAVQVPVNEIVKERPDLEESVKFILPFGSTQETLELMMPASAKRLYALSQADENRLFANDLYRVYGTKMTDYALGKRADKPTYEEVLKDTNSLYKIRSVIGWVSPIAPILDSPYQPIIDSYRNALARLRDDEFALGTHDDGTAVSADEWFLETHGEEYFALTTAFTNSRDGVPPTLEGFAARKKYKDLIEEYPELGGLIIGAEGAGEFAKGVYNSQLAHKIKPGSSTSQRESASFEQVAANPEIRLGWMKYSKYMDLIEAERVRRGLPNLQVAPAADLADTKRQIIEQLEAKYPSWSDAFNKSDRKSFDRRLEGMRDIADDKRLSKRPDIQGLNLYLKYRDLVVQELGRRESKTLTSVANQDLAYQWSSITSQIVEKNPAFADLFYRYLERDPMEVG